MSRRRIEALEALAERGATEGEREAARIALEKHRPKAATPKASKPVGSQSTHDRRTAWQTFYGVSDADVQQAKRRATLFDTYPRDTSCRRFSSIQSARPSA